MFNTQHSSSYNRTYEKKVIEETPRVRISTSGTPFTQSIIQKPFTSSIFQSPFAFPSVLGASGSSSLQTTDDSFHATLDVRDYGADDLKVSVIGEFIVVEATQPEKEDQFGFITKSFTRKYRLPRNVNPEAVNSNLTSDGVLTIIALPPKPKEASPARSIPIKVVTQPGAAAQNPAGSPPKHENGDVQA